MNERNIISIIMPMYNVEKYVGDAIRSVIAQTWRNFELIVINDGSTDNSQIEALKAIGQDSRVQMVTQSNKGLSAARNRGLEMACGNYIYFFDSDDLLTADALEVCMGYIIEFDLDLVAFSGNAFSEMPGSVREIRQYCKPNMLEPMRGLDLLMKLRGAGAYSASVCLCLFSRGLVENQSIKFDEGFIHEDEGFTPQIYCRSQKSISISKTLFLRRIRENSIMSSNRSYKNALGWMMAAKKLDDAMRRDAFNLNVSCRHVIRMLQLDLLRSARFTAENMGMQQQFIQDLKKTFGVGALVTIEPSMAVYAYFNAVLKVLKSVRKQLKFRK